MNKAKPSLIVSIITFLILSILSNEIEINQNNFPFLKRKFLIYNFNERNETIILSNKIFNLSKGSLDWEDQTIESNSVIDSQINNESGSSSSISSVKSSEISKKSNLSSISSFFQVISSLVTRDEINQLMELLSNNTLEFDEDGDSVDSLSTHEFYLQRNGNINDVRHIEGKLDQ